MTLTLPPSQTITLALTQDECQHLGRLLMRAKTLAGTLTMLESGYFRRGAVVVNEGAKDAERLRDTLDTLHETLARMS
jgi:hypothetical protein